MVFRDVRYSQDSKKDLVMSKDFVMSKIVLVPIPIQVGVRMAKNDISLLTTRICVSHAFGRVMGQIYKF